MSTTTGRVNGTTTHARAFDTRPWDALSLVEQQACMLESFSPAEWLSEKGVLVGATVRLRGDRAWYEWKALAKERGVDVYGYEKAVDALIRDLEIPQPTPQGAEVAPLPTRALSAVAVEELSWLWYPYLLHRKINLIEGDPGEGKTYEVLAICAAVTTGFALPDQDGIVGPPHPEAAAHVLYITAEDGLGDTIRPRAEKLKADTDRIFVSTLDELFPGGTPAFSLGKLAALEGAIRERSARLVVLDPLQAFLGQVDINATNQVRPLMTNLVAMLERCNCACIAVRHWNKAAASKALYRGQASIDFAAAARSVLVVGRSPDNPAHRIMAQSKHNLAADAKSIVFAITDTGLEWCGTSDLTADEISAAQPSRQRSTQRQTAMEWLLTELSQGPQPASLLVTAAEAVGISAKTLRTARERLKIETVKQAGVWYWQLATIRKGERYPGMEDDTDTPF